MGTLIRNTFFKTEDWIVVWLGFFIIGLVLLGVRPQLPTFKWTSDGEFRAQIAESRPALEKLAADARAKGDANIAGAAGALQSAVDAGDRAAIQNAAQKLGEAAKSAADPGLKKKGEGLGKKLSEGAGALAGKVFAAGNLLKSLSLGILYLVVAVAGIALLGGSVRAFAAGFPVIFALAWFSQVIAGNATLNYWGLEYVIFALAIGLVISNVFGVPGWLKEAAKSEYYIKTGLVVMGASILFSELLQAGALGIIQALTVVFVVWYVCFWLARKLRVDDELAAMLATGVSICGVSAAIAACGAIKGDRKKLSYVISLILIVAVPMMVVQPWIARKFGIPDVVAGAWLGGTLDTTGSVVAAGALISETAMKVGTIVKFSQNILLGVAAFLLSIWWTLKKGGATAEKPTLKVIWERFPKFVLGFVAVSLVFSFVLDPGVVKETKGLLNGLRTFWFALAFASIGLETRFTELFGTGTGRAAAAFIGAQAFNVVWTLILAYILFGGYLFAVPVIR